MFGSLKMLFKNKDQIAQGVWSMIGPPINLARTTGSYKDFANEFISDDYLFGFFNRYINLMITYFFKIKNPTDRGFIIGKIYELFDPRYKDSRELMKIFDLIPKMKDREMTKLGADHAYIIVGMIIRQDKEAYLNDPIYLNAKKFYEEGEWKKRAQIQKKVLGSLIGNKDPEKMPKDMAIAFRALETTFVKNLNLKFKIKQYNSLKS